MKITRRQIRELIQEQMAGPRLVAKTIKTRSRSVRVKMTPAQAALWAMFPKGLGSGYSGGLQIRDEDSAWNATTPDRIAKVTWGKNGGYSDAISKKLWQAVKALGLTAKSSSDSAHPDGSVVTRGNIWEDADGNTISWSASYGVDKYSNWFGASLTFNQPLEIISDSSALRK